MTEYEIEMLTIAKSIVNELRIIANELSSIDMTLDSIHDEQGVSEIERQHRNASARRAAKKTARKEAGHDDDADPAPF